MSNKWISLSQLEILLKIMRRKIGMQKTREIWEEFREEFRKEREK